MAANGPTMCPVLYPTKEEFSIPFCTFIRKVLKKHPDVPMFKVVPPKGWRPRRRPMPKLRDMEISCPIKQHVFGTRGAYRCLLVEQKTMSAESFHHLAENAHQPPTSGRARNGEVTNKTRARTAAAAEGEVTPSDTLMERSFWSGITINPPVYGADTPQSFFDEKLSYGWNLRDLEGCLLKQSNVPHIPGVTTPMTYFGMWKSFFSWHVEDADLFSINYLHFGAPKVWYCVSPAQRAKFERMAQSLFPDLHKTCNAFLRHKDVLMSPSLLRTYGVEYTQAKQEPNEFIVLNAGAYHSGYNMGFNCAEAVNFATEEWLQLGRSLTRCKCEALKDGVRISMRLFGFSDTDSSSEAGSGSESDADGSEGASDDEAGSEDAAEEVEESEDEEEKEEEAPAPRRRGRPPKALAGRDRGVKRSAPDLSPAARKRTRPGVVAGARARTASPPVSPKPARRTRTARAAALSAQRQRSTRTSAEARARAAKRGAALGRPLPGATRGGGMSKADRMSESLERAAAAAAAIRARAEAARLHAEGAALRGEPPLAVSSEDGTADSAATSFASGSSDGSAAEHASPPGSPHAGGALVNGAALPAAARDGRAPVVPPPSPTAARAQMHMRRQQRLPADASDDSSGDGEPPGGEPPACIVGEDASGRRQLYMVQALPGVPTKAKGHVAMRWLREHEDGLFRPSSEVWEEKEGALISVRTLWVAARPGGGGLGGWKLLTLRSRVLDVDLVD